MMERYFVDSNIFLRYYSHDDERQSAQATDDKQQKILDLLGVSVS